MIKLDGFSTSRGGGMTPVPSPALMCSAAGRGGRQTVYLAAWLGSRHGFCFLELSGLAFLAGYLLARAHIMFYPALITT